MAHNIGSFISIPGFCSDCGSILPLLGDKGNVKCYACKRVWGPEGTYYFLCIFIFSYICLISLCENLNYLLFIYLKSNCKKLLLNDK